MTAGIRCNQSDTRGWSDNPNLGEAERHSTKNQWRISFANGGLFGTMFFMYAFGLWFGAYLIASSTDQAMKVRLALFTLFCSLNKLIDNSQYCMVHVTNLTPGSENPTQRTTPRPRACWMLTACSGACKPNKRRRCASTRKPVKPTRWGWHFSRYFCSQSNS
jgi:hypothetical protein